jgi:hypothetical protein
MPKPDITISFASDYIEKALDLWPNLWQNIFFLHLQLDLNNTQRYISDPYQVPLGLQFPFLIIEAKGLNTGSTPTRAQN